MKQAQDNVAILITDWWEDLPGLPRLSGPRILLPLINKPALQMAIEGLVNLGCKEFHLFLGEDPVPIKEFLGHGSRWGVDISYHFRHPDFDLATNLKRLTLSADKDYWIACPDRLPEFSKGAAGGDFCIEKDSAYCWQNDLKISWIGWGFFKGVYLNSLFGITTFIQLEDEVLSNSNLNKVIVSRPLSVTTDAEYLLSSIEILKKRVETSDQQIIISRSAVIHPSVKISGPAYIGLQARVEAGAELGPNAILCDGAVVDEGSIVVNSVVLPDTYLGPQLSLSSAIAASGRLSSISNDVLVSRIDHWLLTSITKPAQMDRPAFSPLRFWLIRSMLFPLFLLSWLTLKVFRVILPNERVMDIAFPTADGETLGRVQVNAANTMAGIRNQTPGAWISHVVFTFWPGLREVSLGRLNFCGPELRTFLDASALPEHWQEIYFKHKCGLISESQLLSVETPNYNEERFACDSIAASGALQDGVFMRYFLRVCVDFFGLVFGGNRTGIKDTSSSKFDNLNQ